MDLIKRFLIASMLLLIAGVVCAQDTPIPPTAQHVICDSGCGSSATVLMADTTANPTIPQAAAFGMLFNGTTWDRWRGDATSGAFVNVKNASIAVTGAVSAAQSGTWNIGTLTTLTSITNPVTVTDGAGALNVIVDSGSTVVTQGTGTNLHTVLDSGTLTSVTNAVTVAQGTAANLNATVTDGSGPLTVDGTVTANQGSANATPWNENLAQVAGGTVTTVATGTQKVGVADSGGNAIASATTTALDGTGRGLETRGYITQRAGTGVSLTAACGANIDSCAANSTASVTLDNYFSASFYLAAGTLAATLVCDYSVNGSNWVQTYCMDGTSRILSVVLTNPNAAHVLSVPTSGGASKMRVRVSAFTGGAATATGYANWITDPFAIPLCTQGDGVSVSANAVVLCIQGGQDSGGLARAMRVYNTAPADTDYGVLTRCIGECRAVTNNVSIAVSESVAAPTATTWYLKRQWALPSSAHFMPTRVFSAVTTAGTMTRIGIINNMGNLNVSTNAFTDGNAVASPYFYGRLIGCVTTVMSAVANTVTATYTDELGNSQTTAAVTIPASSPVGNCFDFPLNATTGQMLDVGVRDITAMGDSAAPTGVLTMYGMTVLLDALGVANAYEQSDFNQAELNANEQIAILMQQAAVTAQQRSAGVTGMLR